MLCFVDGVCYYIQDQVDNQELKQASRWKESICSKYDVIVYES